MKRLLEQVGLTYLSVLAVVFYFGKISAFIVGFLALLLFLVFLSFKKYRKTIYMPVMALTALIACVVNFVYTDLVYERTVEIYDGYSGTVVATLCDEPYQMNGTYRYYFECESIDGNTTSLKFVSYHDDSFDIEPFDTVEMDVEFIGIDYPRELSKKYFLVGNLGYELPEFNIVKSERPLYYYAIKLRQSIRNSLCNVLSEDSFPLCSALLIGDKYLLSDEISENFRKAGASHIVVVSGMHFSILVSWLFLFANKRYKHRSIFIFIAVIFIFIYMAVTGYSPSVVRSGIMLLICCVGIIISREPYSANSLGFAALVITALNPYSVGDVGLILSFASTYAILMISPILKSICYKRIKFIEPKKSSRVQSFVARFVNKTISDIVSVLCMNISATIASIPLSILFFGSLSSVSVVSTLLLCLPVQYLLITTLILAILCYIPFLSFLIPAFSFCVEILADIVCCIVEFFARLPFSYIYVKHDYVYLWIVMSLVMFLFALYSRSRIKLKIFALCSVMVFLSGYLSASVFDYLKSSLYIYDVGNGMAVMYSDKDVNALLTVECNSSNLYGLSTELQKTVDDVDFCAAVCNTKNSANCVSSLSKVFAISEVLLYDTKRTVYFSPATGNVTEPTGSVTVNLSDDVTAYYFMVEENYAIYLETTGEDVLVLPKYVDVSEVDEKYRSAEVVVVNSCPNNYDLLSCDSLIISAESDRGYSIMKSMSSVCDRIILTAKADIELKLEV